MATAVQVESIWNGLTDNSGQPLAAGKVYTYAAGTTTPISLFTSSDKSTSATNPLILDGNGKAQVWADGRYKFVVKTAADVTLYTLDNLLYGFDDTSVLLGGISTGSANAQTVSVPATVESYVNGQRITFIAGFTNTGATTLRFNALSSVNIVKGPTPSSLQAGDLLAGQLYSCTYYGGSFYLESTPTPADVQRSRSQVLSSVGGINTIIGALTPALTSYEAGQVFRFKAANASTAAVTLNINGLGAQAVQRYGVALVGGEIQANDMVEVVYDGTQFQLVNAVPNPLFIDRTNNEIGIGTTAPLTRLTVAGTGQNGAPSDSGDKLATIRVSSTAGGGNDGGQVEFGAGYGTYTQSYFSAIKGLLSNITGNTLGHLAFYTRNGTSDTSLTERMRINGTGGAVGIGNSDPQYAAVIGNGVGQKIVSIFGGLSGANEGAALFITGTTATNHAAGFGHYSAILGGAADATPTLYTGGNLRFNSSTTVVGVLNGTGLSIGTGTVAAYPLEVQANAGNAVGLSTKGRASDNIGVALFTNNAGTETARIQAAPTSLSIAKDGNNPIALSTNGSERVRVTGTGLVGIGTTGPSEALHVYRASGNVEVLSESNSLANGEMASVHALGGPRTARIMAYKHSGIANPCGALNLDQQDNTPTYVWADDSTVMRVSSTITHIGTTSGTVIGTQTSDARLKDISADPFPYGLSDVLAIEPVAFTFTNDPDQVERIGFSAQQVQPIVAEAVYDTNEQIAGEPQGAPTKLAMDYTALVPVLVKAIQQLEARVAALEA